MSEKQERQEFWRANGSYVVRIVPGKSNTLVGDFDTAEIAAKAASGMNFTAGFSTEALEQTTLAEVMRLIDKLRHEGFELLHPDTYEEAKVLLSKLVDLE